MTCEIEVKGVSGINDVLTDKNQVMEVYNLQGVRLNVSTLEQLNSLAPGLYIVNRKKVYIN